ncbi:MAG TPA: redox-sensing transcriptional repressor Rex [Acidimicrobiia bacterium]
MNQPIPRATVARLPSYLQYLEEVGPGRSTVSSDDIAQATGSTAAQVRKDLSHLETIGTRGVGYNVTILRDLIRRALGLGSPRTVAIVGAGNLGSALAHYAGFVQRGFTITGVYDADPARIGTDAAGITVRPTASLVSDAAEAHFEIGIIATPPDAAQGVANTLVQAGIKAILNFAPVVVKVPSDVTVRRVDLATELRILSYHIARNQ